MSTFGLTDTHDEYRELLGEQDVSETLTFLIFIEWRLLMTDIAASIDQMIRDCIAELQDSDMKEELEALLKPGGFQRSLEKKNSDKTKDQE